MKDQCIFVKTPAWTRIINRRVITLQRWRRIKYAGNPPVGDVIPLSTDSGVITDSA
jgi:hypothetical protein